MDVTALEHCNDTLVYPVANMTVTVQVPVLTNMVPLRDGEQLFIESVARDNSAKRKVETWKTSTKVVKRQTTSVAAPDWRTKAGGRDKQDNVEI
jgi:hypothetical protein